MVLGADEGEDDEVGGHNSDENTLDEGIVRHYSGTGRRLDGRSGVFSTSCETNEMSKNDAKNPKETCSLASI